MANLVIEDYAGKDSIGAAGLKEIKATGTGTTADPYIVEVATTVTVDTLPAGTNNIGDVDIASIAAGETLIGLVGASDIVVTVTPTCDTNAYASGDLIFDSTEIANAVRANGYCCVLQSITLLDKADQGVAMTLVLLNAATDMGTLNEAPNPDDTEAATIIGHVPVAATDYLDVGASKIACIRNIGLTLKAGASATSLYVAAINGTGTPTYGANDLVIQFGFLRS